MVFFTQIAGATADGSVTLQLENNLNQSGVCFGSCSLFTFHARHEKFKTEFENFYIFDVS